MSAQNCNKSLEMIYDKWRNLQKNAKSKYEKHRESEKEFIDWIENYIFDIATADALQTMRIQQDKDFLILQRQRGRPGSMIGLDVKMLKTQKRREKRLKITKKRIEKYREKTVNLDLSSLNDISSSTQSSELDSSVIGQNTSNDVVMISAEDELAIEAQGQCQQSRGKIHFIDDRMLASIDKCKVSTRDAMHIISATASALLRKIHEVNPASTSIKLDD